MFPSESIKLRPEGTTDDFIGTGFYANDKQTSNPPSRGTQHGNLDSKDTFTDTELKKLLGSINMGKRLSKKVTHLLKSRSDLLASLRKGLRDYGHHSSKERRSHLDGSTMSIHGMTVESNMQYPEMDDQVITGSTVLKGTGTVSQKTSEYDDQELSPVTNRLLKRSQKENPLRKEQTLYEDLDSEESGAPINMEPESADTEWGSGGIQDTETESEADALSPEDTEWDSGALIGTPRNSRYGT